MEIATSCFSYLSYENIFTWKRLDTFLLVLLFKMEKYMGSVS